MWITRENDIISYEGFGIFSFIFEDLSNYTAAFLILTIFIFGAMGNWGDTFTPKFWVFGQYL